VGCLLAYASFATRSLWSPLPGFGIAALVLTTAAVAIRLVWRGHRFAPLSIGIAGVALFATFLSLGWLFPVVHASSEPPSIFEQYWYPTSLVVIAALSIGGTWASWYLLPMRSNER
jgi:hypothetical protein